VDDEPPARAKIRSFLEPEGDVEVIAECGDGPEAVSVIRRQTPDLLFLDIEMPGLDGLEVIEEIGAAQMPVTVFVTAFDRYAVQAFEKHAVDYLLKPFDRERFRRTLIQVRDQLDRSGSQQLNRQLQTLLDSFKGQHEYADRLTVKSPRGMTFLRSAEVEWVDAAGNYVRLNAGGNAYLMRETMSSLEKRLDPARFLRIHRSTIVNIERIREIRPLQHGEHLVILDCGQRLTLSRSYRGKLDELSR
jgi:two-component system LytT family response regulator